jgi:hypothetical protein
MIKIFSKVIPKLIVLFFALNFLFYSTAANCQESLNRLKDVASGDGGAYSETTDANSFYSLLGTIIEIFLSLLGMIFIVLMIFAGYNWMTAGGDEGKVKKARDIITTCIIGLLVVVGAYAIWMYVFRGLFF